ncbi:5'/3'-nucleotidase SurE, partial [Alistipes indistinctus]
MTKPLIFLTNDDGVNAKGFRNLIDTVRPLGRIIAVAPENGQSGMSHAIT